MFGWFKSTPTPKISVCDARGKHMLLLEAPLLRTAVQNLTTYCNVKGINSQGDRYWQIAEGMATTLVGPDGTRYTVPEGWVVTYICE